MGHRGGEGLSRKDGRSAAESTRRSSKLGERETAFLSSVSLLLYSIALFAAGEKLDLLSFVCSWLDGETRQGPREVWHLQ